MLLLLWVRGAVLGSMRLSSGRPGGRGHQREPIPTAEKRGADLHPGLWRRSAHDGSFEWSPGTAAPDHRGSHGTDRLVLSVLASHSAVASRGGL